MEIENLNEFREKFYNADDRMVFLKDENFKYVIVNNAFREFHKEYDSKIIGFNDFELFDLPLARARRKIDQAVLDTKNTVHDEMTINGRYYKITKFPVTMPNGKTGIGGYIYDITKEHEYINRQAKVLERNKIMVDVFSLNFNSIQEQLDYVLHRALEMTGSEYGYIYFYDEEKKEFTLNSWTNGVMADCTIMDKQTTYQLEKTGIWGEVIRQRQLVVVNDFKQPNPYKKGYPQGHVILDKYMSVPIIIDGKIVAVIGMGNKTTDYDENDVYELTLLMNGAWQATQRREVQEKLFYERNKYLQTLNSIGDGVMVVDKDANIEMLNPVAQKLTGWSMEESKGKHYKEVFLLSYENQNYKMNDPIEEVFKTDTVRELGNHAVLTAKDGTKYYIEDSAAPIKNEKKETVGVILVFRDVTEKSVQRKEIEYLSFHDALTGLYNRRYLEEELTRLDTDRNLPFSIIMGDVNGLKLTNDVFGHAYGDLLLKGVADVLNRVCRADDIVARWGGDEFVILLPKTSCEDAANIVHRIKEEFAKEQVKAIKGSISIGGDCKKHPEEDIFRILNSAEEKMYSAKTLERNSAGSDVIHNIISILHQYKGVEEHDIRVSKLCEEMGKTLGLSPEETTRLKEAGYLHDIGKIVFNPKLMDRRRQFSEEEMAEFKNHPIVGYRILNYFDDTLDLAEPIFAHHEHWDGSGFPKGLKKEEIPLLGRIIALVSYYDSIVYDENNRKNLSDEEIIKILKATAGKEYDPNLVDVLIRWLSSESFKNEADGKEDRQDQ